MILNMRQGGAGFVPFCPEGRLHLTSVVLQINVAQLDRDRGR